MMTSNLETAESSFFTPRRVIMDPLASQVKGPHQQLGEDIPDAAMCALDLSIKRPSHQSKADTLGIKEEYEIKEEDQSDCNSHQHQPWLCNSALDERERHLKFFTSCTSVTTESDIQGADEGSAMGCKMTENTSCLKTENISEKNFNKAGYSLSEDLSKSIERSSHESVSSHHGYSDSSLFGTETELSTLPVRTSPGDSLSQPAILPSPSIQHQDNSTSFTSIKKEFVMSSAFSSEEGATTSETPIFEKRRYGGMLPILSVPKVRLRQDRTRGANTWTLLPKAPASLSIGGYRLDNRREEAHHHMSRHAGQGTADTDSSHVANATNLGEGSSSATSLLQMALQHGSTHIASQVNSQDLNSSSVGTCPILPINPKTLREAKPRMRSREKRYYQCEHCDIVYEQARKLDRHLRDSQGKAPYQCCYCQMAFPTIGCRRFHTRLHADKTMPCPYCPKVFSEKRRYEDHVRSHTGEAPFMCQECGNVYRTRSALRIHKRTHGNDKPLQCRFCPKRFIRIGDVQVHERTHTGEKPYKCGICESSFATSSQVNRHRRTHSEERPHKCSYCNKTFKNPDYLITHEKMHMGFKPHHCSYCPKTFRTPRELVHHERVHTGEKPFECAECGHRFSKKTNLKQHELQHSGVKSFKCAKCPKSFFRKASLIWHEKIHENRERFLCKRCGKLFFKESSRDKHILKAHLGEVDADGGGEEEEGEEDRCGDGVERLEEKDACAEAVENHTEQEDTIQESSDSPMKVTMSKRTPPRSPANDAMDCTCEECGKTFLARRSLLRHYRAIHNRYISRNGDGESPAPRPKKFFVCRLCPKSFQTDHLRHVHENMHTNASFTCDTCGKTFSTRQLLVKHKKIHSKVKPFVCETCGSAFAIKWYLNRHVNVVHSEVYSYPCTVCDKKFKAKTALSVHMQLHNVEGNCFQCDQCDAEFHVKRYLARHKRKYHRNTRSDEGDLQYDYEEDGFGSMDDSDPVSGVCLREMLSKGVGLKQRTRGSKRKRRRRITQRKGGEDSKERSEKTSGKSVKVKNSFEKGRGVSNAEVASSYKLDQQERPGDSEDDIASVSGGFPIASESRGFPSKLVHGERPSSDEAGEDSGDDFQEEINELNDVEDENDEATEEDL